MELELTNLGLPSDNERPFVIAGPCSAETEEQVMETAREAATTSVLVYGSPARSQVASKVMVKRLCLG